MIPSSSGRQHVAVWRLPLVVLSAMAVYCWLAASAYAHNGTPGDAGYIQEIWGVKLIPFTYLGAKHMITGYDHILFLLGVVFFLYKMKDVAIYVSLFAIGHTLTMIPGVWFGWGINAFIIDAIIGFSVVYKALDNMGYLNKWLGFQPNTKAATLIFGLLHGTGLASKIMDYQIAEEGLLANLIAFNVGVEIGQLLALGAILIVMGYWRRTDGFLQQGYRVNSVMVIAGLLLMGLHVTGYINSFAEV